MQATTGISKQLMKHLIEEHGKNKALWPEELRDLINPTIEARSISPPISGKVDEFLNTDYHYHWAYDKCGQEPNHDRVESMRYAGWEFATTDDVRMCSEEAIKGRKKDRPSKDGNPNGFSDEIRSGDRRMMKLPMRLWKQTKKAQNLAAYQLAYGGGAFDVKEDGKGMQMSAANFIPGLKTEVMDDEEITETRRKANPSNSVTIERKKEQ